MTSSARSEKRCSREVWLHLARSSCLAAALGLCPNSDWKENSTWDRRAAVSYQIGCGGYGS